MDIGATVALALAVQLGGLGKHRAGLTEKQNDARTKVLFRIMRGVMKIAEIP